MQSHKFGFSLEYMSLDTSDLMGGIKDSQADFVVEYFDEQAETLQSNKHSTAFQTNTTQYVPLCMHSLQTCTGEEAAVQHDKQKEIQPYWMTLTQKVSTLKNAKKTTMPMHTTFSYSGPDDTVDDLDFSLFLSHEDIQYDVLGDLSSDDDEIAIDVSDCVELEQCCIVRFAKEGCK